MKISNYHVPEELVKFSYSYADGEDYGFQISHIRFSDNSIHLVFYVYFGSLSSEVNCEWELSIDNYRDFHIEYEWSDGFTIYDTHPLLLKYLENEIALYFSSNTCDSNKLLTDIYSAHVAICQGFIPVEKFLNHKYLNDACIASFGLFARGPISIIQKYKDVMDRYQIVNNIHGPFQPKYWDGEKHVVEPADMKLFIMGESYFIGQEFKFEKIS